MSEKLLQSQVKQCGRPGAERSAMTPTRSVCDKLSTNQDPRGAFGTGENVDMAQGFERSGGLIYSRENRGRFQVPQVEWCSTK